MSAILLSFPSAARARPSASPAQLAYADHRAELELWIASATGYGWFLIETTSTEPFYTIGHSAVDEEGIFQVSPDFDGWEVLSRRGQLLVYGTLAEALASICPAGTERAA